MNSGHRGFRVGLLLGVVALSGWQDLRGDEKLTVRQTPGGREYAVLGEKPAAPAPTLFVFANTYDNTLRNIDYNQVGQILAKHGVISVAMDLPCHGAQRRDGEPEGIAGWRARLEKGEDPIGACCQDASAVLDHLIAEGYTDPKRIAACGNSRGGFMALHFAASEPRVRCVAGFAPVTNLLLLREFEGLSPAGPAAALLAADRAEALSARPVWLMIGTHDERVGTDSVISLARAINKSAVTHQKLALVELHVQPSEGHRLPANGQVDAARWFERHLELTP